MLSYILKKLRSDPVRQTPPPPISSYGGEIAAMEEEVLQVQCYFTSVHAYLIFMPHLGPIPSKVKTLEYTVSLKKHTQKHLQ